MNRKIITIIVVLLVAAALCGFLPLIFLAQSEPYLKHASPSAAMIGDIAEFSLPTDTEAVNGDYRIQESSVVLLDDFNEPIEAKVTVESTGGSFFKKKDRQKINSTPKIDITLVVRFPDDPKLRGKPAQIKFVVSYIYPGMVDSSSFDYLRAKVEQTIEFTFLTEAQEARFRSNQRIKLVMWIIAGVLGGIGLLLGGYVYYMATREERARKEEEMIERLLESVDSEDEEQA